MRQLVLIAIGGSLGALARYGISLVVYHQGGETFPWGTLVVNITGCFLIGFFSGIFEGTIIPSAWRSFITIGFIGAYTTFSTYSFETVNLLQDGEISLATANILANNVFGIAFVLLGSGISRLMLKTIA